MILGLSWILFLEWFDFDKVHSLTVNIVVSNVLLCPVMHASL